MMDLRRFEVTFSGSSLIPRTFAFDFVFEIKVRFIEGVHPHIAILAAAGVAKSLWMHRYRVQWAEVSLDTPNLIFKDLMVKSRLEFALSCRRCRDVHGRLPAPKNHKVLLRCYRSCVERCVGYVGLED
jgi:hypothetical protein